MSKIYITGFNGYLGSVICNKISKENIIKIGNPETKYKDKSVLTNFPKKIDKNSICLHLASVSGVESEKNKKKTFITNVELTKKVCDLNFKKVIFFSTSAVYGASEKTLSENDEINPTNYYTETKVLAENIVKLSRENVILRMSILMGVSPNINWNLFINSLIRDIKTEKKIEIYNPNHYRPFLNIKDAANCVLQLLKDSKVSGIYNFGFTDMNFNKLEILEILKKLFSKLNYSVVSDEKKIYSTKPRNYKVNCEKIKKYFKNKTELFDTFKELEKVNLD